MIRIAIVSIFLTCSAGVALAETYQERVARWKTEWREQHPNEPMPSDGVLQKLHRDELIKQSNADWDAGRKKRQEDLRREYLLSRYHQQQINTKSGVKWNDAQWRAWDQRYNAEHKQQAEDFARNWAMMSEMARQQAAQEEYERSLRGQR
ncbi:MAG TPA: hypothetical protein VHB46_04310 [Burkholderiales bacterium]|nr:hypothetical protein [Burkholderiales bacterium]